MIYYDYFEEEYVTEKDEYAPPERYLGYMKGREGIYTERYRLFVNGYTPSLFDFSYTEFERDNFPKAVAINRQCHFEKHNVHPKSAVLIAYIVPPSVYNKIIEEWKLTEKEVAE